MVAGFDETDKSCEALIVRSKDRVNKDFLTGFPNVKTIVSATSGFDHFNLKLVKESPNIFFGYSPEANIISCAELTLMHILNLLKRQNLHLKPKRYERHLGLELNNMTALIIGFGRIGKKVSHLLKVFGVHVLAYDPYASKKDFATLKVETVSLKKGLETSDIVTLHCPLTQKTEGLIDLDFLKSMKNDAFLINCARGNLVVEKDLVMALDKRIIQGAALDVFETEPLPQTSTLWTLPNAFLSPHLGGYTEKAQIRSALEALRQVENYLGDRKQELCPLPLEASWFKDLGLDAY